jgi:hypothetical protein
MPDSENLTVDNVWQDTSFRARRKMVVHIIEIVTLIVSVIVEAPSVCKEMTMRCSDGDSTPLGGCMVSDSPRSCNHYAQAAGIEVGGEEANEMFFPWSNDPVEGLNDDWTCGCVTKHIAKCGREPLQYLLKERLKLGCIAFNSQFYNGNCTGREFNASTKYITISDKDTCGGFCSDVCSFSDRGVLFQTFWCTLAIFAIQLFETPWYMKGELEANKVRDKTLASASKVLLRNAAFSGGIYNLAGDLPDSLVWGSFWGTLAIMSLICIIIIGSINFCCVAPTAEGFCSGAPE